MTTTTYYFPSVDGAGASAGNSGFAGVQNYQGQFQASPGSYTVITFNTDSPNQYQAIFNYTGPGTGTPDTLYQTAYEDTNHNETTDGVYDFILTNGPVPANYAYSFSSTVTPFVPTTTGTTTDPTVCFTSGTLIRTLRGDVAVEDLRLGDMVETYGGVNRAIKWLGHRTIACRRHARPAEVMPIRVATNAFGESRPVRDLFVSPGHSICVDVLGEILIPASSLVNGSTIVQVDVDEVTYWHVELDSHDIILAENLPAESYLDMGNRGFFIGANVVDLGAGPDARMQSHADFCRPFVAAGPIVDAVRATLNSLAAKQCERRLLRTA